MTKHTIASASLAMALVACASNQPPAAATSPAPAPAHSPVIDVAGFQTPESVVHDTRADVYLVSNIAGAPGEADDNGFISRVRPDGTVEQLRWIDGAAPEVTLNAPTGLAIANGLLYVCDLTVVRTFDLASGEPRDTIEFPGSTFLNDVAASANGTVYVSDSGFHADFSRSGTDAIYAIAADGSVSTVAASPDLGGPNGLLPRADGVWVVTFATGELYRVDADGQRSDVQQLPAGQLDGLVETADGQFVISSWEASSLFQGEGAEFATVGQQAPAPADISLDARRNRVLIPLFKDNTLRIAPL